MQASQGHQAEHHHLHIPPPEQQLPPQHERHSQHRCGHWKHEPAPLRDTRLHTVSFSSPCVSRWHDLHGPMLHDVIPCQACWHVQPPAAVMTCAAIPWRLSEHHCMLLHSTQLHLHAICACASSSQCRSESHGHPHSTLCIRCCMVCCCHVCIA